MTKMKRTEFGFDDAWRCEEAQEETICEESTPPEATRFPSLAVAMAETTHTFKAVALNSGTREGAPRDDEGVFVATVEGATPEKRLEMTNPTSEGQTTSKAVPRNFATPSDLRAQNRRHTGKIGSLLGKGIALDESFQTPVGHVAAMPVSLARLFSTANGSSLRFSKQKEAAVQKLFSEEEEQITVRPPSRKRPLGNAVPEKQRKRVFATPRVKPSLEPLKTLPPGMPSESTAVVRRSTFSEYGCQQTPMVLSKRASCLPPRVSNGQRVTLASVKERLLGRRYTKGWRPTSPLTQQTDSDMAEDSPLEQLALGSFSADSTISPTCTAAYVFSNGASALSLYNALVDSGCTLTLAWVKQHYRWIVWRLSGIRSDGESALTADNAFLELKYRFTAEKAHNTRLSMLDAFAESGNAESVVLVVGDVILDETQSTRLELSDGYRSLIGDLDSGLQQKCERDEIQPGTLLFIEGLKIQICTAGSLETHLRHNSCWPVPGDTPLGCARQGASFLPLSKVDRKGGPISTTLLCISRRYPILFQHQGTDGRAVYLTKRQHQKRLDSYRKELEQMEATARAMVQDEETKHFKSVLERHKQGQKVQPTELHYAQYVLSNNENEAPGDAADQDALQRFRLEHEKTLESCLKKQMAQLKVDWGTSLPEDVPCLPLEVTEVAKDTTASPKPALLKVVHLALCWEARCVLQVWLQVNVFSEGDVFEFRNLSIGSEESGEACLVLNAGVQSAFRKICSASEMLPGHSCHFMPRSPIQDFTALEKGALFDLEAFVMPQTQSEMRICAPIDSRTPSPLIIISRDPFETLSPVRNSLIWSFTDLEMISYAAEHGAVVAEVTQKTVCTLMKSQRRLEKLRTDYKRDRKAVDGRMRQIMDAL